jgi:hypothetical protein
MNETKTNACPHETDGNECETCAEIQRLLDEGRLPY